jgi:hypothetical protein
MNGQKLHEALGYKFSSENVRLNFGHSTAILLIIKARMSNKKEKIK